MPYKITKFQTEVLDWAISQPNVGTQALVEQLIDKKVNNIDVIMFLLDENRDTTHYNSKLTKALGVVSFYMRTKKMITPEIDAKIKKITNVWP